MIKKSVAVAIFLSLAFTAGSARAQEEAAEAESPWSASLDAPLYSRYLWRGLNLCDDWVFQPSFEGGYKWATLMVWGNMDLTNENLYEGHGDTAGDFTEIDYMLHLRPQIGIVRVEAGAYWYTYPNTGEEPTVEVYAGVGLDVFSQPTLIAYYDVELAHGIYWNLTFEHTLEEALKISDSVSMSVDLGLSIGLGDPNHDEFYYGVEHEGLIFTDAEYYVGFPFAIGDRVTFAPAVGYSAVLDPEIRELFKSEDVGLKTENVYYGAGLTVTL